VLDLLAEAAAWMAARGFKHERDVSGEWRGRDGTPFAWCTSLYRREST